MNKLRKNIVVVGFTNIERKSLSIPNLPAPYCDSQQVYYVDNLRTASTHQGYMLIIDNKENIPIIELDKKYRYIFNKYERVFIYNETYNDYDFNNKWCNIDSIGRSIFNMYYFSDIWDEYKKIKGSKKDNLINFNKIKLEKLERLYNYIKKYKTRKTKDIVKDLNISERTIQRYMHDLNNINHNIGYDYSLNEWYFS